jgi:hypothetical protein
VVTSQSLPSTFTTKAWAWPAVSAAIAKVTPRAGLASDNQQRVLGLEVLPLALVDGLELKDDMVGLK